MKSGIPCLVYFNVDVRLSSGYHRSHASLNPLVLGRHVRRQFFSPTSSVGICRGRADIEWSLARSYFMNLTSISPHLWVTISPHLWVTISPVEALLARTRGEFHRKFRNALVCFGTQSQELCRIYWRTYSSRHGMLASLCYFTTMTWTPTCRLFILEYAITGTSGSVALPRLWARLVTDSP